MTIAFLSQRIDRICFVAVESFNGYYLAHVHLWIHFMAGYSINRFLVINSEIGASDTRIFGWASMKIDACLFCACKKLGGDDPRR